MDPRRFGRVVATRVAGIRVKLHPTVFGLSASLIVVFVGLTLANLDAAEAVFQAIRTWVTDYFGWLFILLVQFFLLFSLYLAISRFGHIRLGGADAKPDFSRGSWFAMLFSAGMGIGLMFWSVAEPVMHFESPPLPAATPGAAAQRALDTTFLHWGLHAWGIYALVGLALAYYSFNRGLPLTVRSAFYPFFGERIYGPLGDVIDILAVVATLFGVATSLGFGVSQINAGLAVLMGTPVSVPVQLGLITFITMVATLSVVSGLDKGIKRLSQLNLLLALALMLFVLLAGPTLFLLKAFVQQTGHYLQNLLTLGSWTETYQADADWQASWTIFYWAWWIAWSPFVGMFIARISRGRTVREFILGVLLVPASLTFLWVTVFGGSALYQAMFEQTGIVAAVNADVSTAIYHLLDNYPISKITSGVAVILVFVFFVTSSDSGSLVIDIITAGGRTDPPVSQRIFWAVSEGVVAAVLLLGGGLGALQTASVTTGLPFAIIVCLLAVGLQRAFAREMPPPVHRSRIARGGME